jgi:hypothetical protein
MGALRANDDSASDAATRMLPLRLAGIGGGGAGGMGEIGELGCERIDSVESESPVGGCTLRCVLIPGCAKVAEVGENGTKDEDAAGCAENGSRTERKLYMSRLVYEVAEMGDIPDTLELAALLEIDSSPSVRSLPLSFLEPSFGPAFCLEPDERTLLLLDCGRCGSDEVREREIKSLSLLSRFGLVTVGSVEDAGCEPWALEAVLLLIAGE